MNSIKSVTIEFLASYCSVVGREMAAEINPDDIIDRLLKGEHDYNLQSYIGLRDSFYFFCVYHYLLRRFII